MRFRAAGLAALLALHSCGKLPTSESPPLVERPQASIPPVTSSGTPPPILSGTPTPAPSPSGGTSPTPAPSASASAPTGAGCRLPAMPECGAAEDPPGVFGCCRKENDSLFLASVDAAIAQIQREQPALFSGDRVLNPNAYVQGVARILETRGFCARQGAPEDEVAVKNSNGFSEQFDILFANGGVRTGGYTVSCRPARF